MRIFCRRLLPLSALLLFNMIAQRYAAMSWAQRLKRVFKIDIETCEQCGGAVKVIACIEEPEVVKRILDHLQNRSESPQPASHPVRAPPPHPELDRP